MPAKRKRNAVPQLNASRRSKTLFLPMPRAQADGLMLNYRITLDAVRRGHGDGALVRRLFIMVLLTRFVTEAGHGVLDLQVVEEGETALAGLFEHGTETGDWRCDDGLLGLVEHILNEHDRQLRETRLAVLIDASNRLDGVLERMA